MIEQKKSYAISQKQRFTCGLIFANVCVVMIVTTHLPTDAGFLWSFVLPILLSIAASIELWRWHELAFPIAHGKKTSQATGEDEAGAT